MCVEVGITLGFKKMSSRVGGNVRQEDGQVRIDGCWGVCTSHSRNILDADTVALLDDRDIAPEALTSRQSPSRLEVMEEGAC